jgi:hypothetical protein
VLFGVDEDKDAAARRRKVDQTLLCVSGYNVDVTGMFLVGRHALDKIRPIVVKLRTAWDRSIIIEVFILAFVSTLSRCRIFCMNLILVILTVVSVQPITLSILRTS